MKKRLFFQKQKKGSMLVGALLALFMVAIISLAIIKRAVIGLNISIDSGKSYQSYQESDKKAENILTDIRKLDNGEFDPYLIPENTPASKFCGDSNEKNCLMISSTDSSGFEPVDVNTKVSAIARVVQKGEANSSTRAVAVPVPQRIQNTISDLKVEQCISEGNPSGCVAGGTSNIKCNVKISWDDSIVDNNVVEDYEVRRYTGDIDAVSCNLSQNNSDNGWFNILPISGINSEGTEGKYIIAQGGNNDFQYYCFTMKLKNKKNFWLDSLYYDSDPEDRSLKLEECN